ncbi:hypothetical protein SCLCIDRAFT_1218310 [Scleroderma citrinum Foug A]|uniref:Uncharacterized protein n=1 Tax=Scleroderma citrinum Foug A TaxID=1036808 RepID=A0A0C2ZA62_9AGAM|nr:hypothetical protein SCLCIDRAFT_1218310 [Scleroderma citrinum Foug A]
MSAEGNAGWASIGFHVSVIAIGVTEQGPGTQGKHELTPRIVVTGTTLISHEIPIHITRPTYLQCQISCRARTSYLFPRFSPSGKPSDSSIDAI